MKKFLLIMLFFNSSNLKSDSSNSSMYKSYAKYYDIFYNSKNYNNESEFLNKILANYNVKKVLDVGCGTGTHISKLQKYGYSCSGIDLNKEMLNFAKNKIRGTLFQADMRNFKLSEVFDAVICMFAVFNHNLNEQDALQTLIQIKKHLTTGGIIILDLYNPQSSGEKIEKINNITRIMKWSLDTENKICHSIVKFLTKPMLNPEFYLDVNSELNEICNVSEMFSLRIYSITEIQSLLEKAGYKNIIFYDNYTQITGTSISKNLIIVAQL